MRKLIPLLMALILALSSALTGFAAEGKVTYSGNAGEFIFAPGSEYSLTDLFPNFKDVMPGDSLTQKITVKNDASKEVKVKVYIRSLGAHEDSVEFLSQLRLAVKKSADNDMAYMFDAAADESAQLTDWVYLGMLYSGGEVNLDVVLTVPVELDSAYQSQIGYLDWQFKVEEFPIEPGDPGSPQTGDDVSVGFWIALIAALVLILFLIVWVKRARKKEEISAEYS